MNGQQQGFPGVLHSDSQAINHSWSMQACVWQKASHHGEHGPHTGLHLQRVSATSAVSTITVGLGCLRYSQGDSG